MKKITELQKRTLLSLLIIIPFIYPTPLFIIFSFIGGYNLGKVIKILTSK